MQDLTLRKAIQLAITIEQMGADYYRRMERKFDDNAELKEIFGRLIKDEISHEAQFKAILEKTPEESIGDQQYELYQYLRATAISGIFRQEAVKKTDDIKTKEEALGFALSFEKATLQFYQAIQDIVGDNPQLKEIMNAERKHVVALMKVITADGKFRSTNDPW